MPKYFLVLLLCLSLSTCANKKHERKVVLYTDTPEVLAKELAALFESKTGIHVEPVLEGTSWLMSRMRSEVHSPIADVFMGASGTIPGIVCAREGLFAQFTPKGAENLPLQEGKLLLRDEQWRWTAFGFASLGLVYSAKELARANLPAAWEDLAKSEWKDTLTIWDPAVSGTATLFLVSAIQRAIAGGGTEEDGWKFLHGFYNSIKKYAEEGPPVFAVAQGIVKLGVHLDNQFIYYKEKSKTGREDLRFYLPPKSVILTDPVALIAGAPHPEEAKQFIEFLGSPEAQAILSHYFWTRDASGAIYLPKEHPYNARGISAEALLKNALTMDFSWMADNFDKARVYWQNHVEQ